MNIKNKPIQWLLAAILTTTSGFLIAQPVILNPLASAEAIYGVGAGSLVNNTGNDVCFLPAAPPNDMVNVLVHEGVAVGTINLTHQYMASGATGINVAIGSSLPPGTRFSDPDVVSVVSSGPGLGGLKQRILVTYIAEVPGFLPRVFLEMYNWTGVTFALAAAPFDLSVFGGKQFCKTPNIDADYLGNYAVVWEEGARIFMASDNVFTSWGAAPVNFVNHSAACGLLGDEQEPDVCLIPDGGSVSLINVTFKRNYDIYVERMWTTQLVPGLIPFPSSNCSSPMFFTQNVAPNFPSDLRIACPPTVTGTRNIFDVTVAFGMSNGPNNDIVTATHDFSSYGLGAFAFNMINITGSGTFPATGMNYMNRKPAIAYKLVPDEFVVGWEFADRFTGTNNSHFFPSNNNTNLVAVRCSDANNPLNFDMSKVNNVPSANTMATSVSMSKGDITRIQYGFVKDGNTTRYNSTFPGANLKKETPGKLWFVAYPDALSATSSKTSGVDIQLYPNPIAFNTGSIQLELNNTDVSEISIVTLDGKQVYRQALENQVTVTIPNQFPKGIYFVVIKSADTQTTKKLVIQ